MERHLLNCVGKILSLGTPHVKRPPVGAVLVGLLPEPEGNAPVDEGDADGRVLCGRAAAFRVFFSLDV